VADPTPKEIRERFQEYRDAWREIRDEAALDMKAISPEGPWSEEDRDARKGSGRPCIHLDQLNQFLAQVNGNVRKSKRGIQATPKGNGANDQDAQRRSSVIMAIEERSQAQPIYLGAFQSMLERSYGFSVIRTAYKELTQSQAGEDGGYDPSAFDQEILIKPVMNPDMVLLSPYYKQPDASDIPDGFLLDNISKKQFKEKYPKARITNFDDQNLDDATITDWIREKYVMVAEFWEVQTTFKTLLLIETAKGPVVFTEKEWKQAKEHGLAGEVKRERRIEIPKVFQFMTNGLEILDKKPWDGSRIPIISCLGPERWTTEGGTAKRQILSMVRFARDPQMLLDYFASGECEEAGQIPKSPFVGAKGQFESDKEAWDEVTKVPHAYLQYDLLTDLPAGAAQPPPPTRPQWTPNFAVWEVAKDSAGRSVQSAMGITPLPDAAQRRNQKSGVALEKIDDMESLGSFQFVDRYENCYLHNMGYQVNELITPILDTQREVAITQPDGKRSTLQLVGRTSHPIDDQGAYQVQGLPDEHLHTAKGDYGITISTGPSYQSEREEQDEFVDSLIQNIATLPQPGTPAAKVLALGIRMRPTLGPIGKQIADVFDPPPPDPNMPPQVQAQIQQLQAALTAAQTENSGLHMERAGKVLEQQTKLIMEQMKQDGQNWREQLANDIKVLVAEIGAKSQGEQERMRVFQAFWEENHGAAHEAGLQAMQHQHDAEQSQIQRTLAAQAVSEQGQPAAPGAGPAQNPPGAPPQV
jgi:Phage P22-like portal protein